MQSAIIITSPPKAEAAWRALASPDCLYDEWSFRRLFFDDANAEIAFFVDRPDNPDALLPLQRSHADGTLRYLGSPFMERNRGYFKAGCEHALLALYAQLDGSLVLDDISGHDPVTATPRCTASDPAYLLRSSEGLEPSSALVSRLPANIRENIRRIGKRVTTGEITEQHMDLAEAACSIRALARLRFGDDSWMELSAIQRGISGLPTLTGELGASVHCTGLYTADRFIAGCISLRYRDDFHMLMAAAEHSNALSGLGSYLYYRCMADAFSQGCRTIDTGIGDGGWKERWGLEQIPQFLFT